MSLHTQLDVFGDEVVLKVRHIGQPKIVFNAHTHFHSFYKVNSMSIKAGNKVVLSISPVDAFGNAAVVDGVPVWSVSDDTLATLETSGGGLSTVLSSTGKVGTITVTVVADADLSEGVRSLSGSVDVEVTPGEAVDLGVHAEPITVAVAPAAPVVDTTVPNEPAVDAAVATDPNAPAA